jgi:hypothetical protein
LNMQKKIIITEYPFYFTVDIRENLNLNISSKKVRKNAEISMYETMNRTHALQTWSLDNKFKVELDLHFDLFNYIGIELDLDYITIFKLLLIQLN